MNLKTDQFKYLVKVDESYDAELFGNYDEESITEARSYKENYYEIPGKKGFIYFYSQTLLAATIINNAPFRRWARGNDYKIIQNGDDELTFLFPNADIYKVGQFIGAYKKRGKSKQPTLITTGQNPY